MSYKKKIVAYVRVSTVKQLDGAGPDQQRNAISSWAIATNTMIDEFALDAETGDNEDREEIVRLKEMAVGGKLKTIVVDRLDRFARDMLVSEVLYRFFQKHHVKVVAVTQDFDDNANGVAYRQIMSVFAQLDKANRISHLKQCRKATTAAKGTSCGGITPYGYKAIKGTGQLALVPGEAKLVVRTFELHGNGLNLSEIARLLEQEGFRTRKGTAFAPTQVSRMLQREAVYRSQQPVNHITLDDGVVAAQPAVLK